MTGSTLPRSRLESTHARIFRSGRRRAASASPISAKSSSRGAIVWLAPCATKIPDSSQKRIIASAVSSARPEASCQSARRVSATRETRSTNLHSPDEATSSRPSMANTSIAARAASPPSSAPMTKARPRATSRRRTTSLTTACRTDPRPTGSAPSSRSMARSARSVGSSGVSRNIPSRPKASLTHARRDSTHCSEESGASRPCPTRTLAPDRMMAPMVASMFFGMASRRCGQPRVSACA